jgi:ABC-2 type transport system ATP-binding protein
MLAVSLVAGLAACSSSVPPGDVAARSGQPRVPVSETRAGTQQHVVLVSKVDGADISFELFEPDQLEAGQTYPLVLHGHGYGGSRQTTRDGFIGRLTAAGYYAISIDQRGFGLSGGQVRVMDPEYEGQDLIQILDWAEEIPGLRRRGNGEMIVGSFGGSYGGMYQLLLAGVDPRHRLRVLAPDITPHDLPFALNPRNVVKSGWDLALIVGGEAAVSAELTAGGLPTGTQQDPLILETLVKALLTNNFPAGALNLFAYHSVRYFCDGLPPGPQDFLIATPDQLSIPPTPFPAVDVLLTQGVRDTLFNLNDGLNNYDCLRRAGGDVRLLTHESGHILPVALPASVEQALDPLYAVATIPGFQDAGGPRNCGSLDLNEVQFAWFEEKLQGRTGALDAALAPGPRVCMSLAAGDAIAVADVKVGGTGFALDSTIPQFNGVLGITTTVLGNGAREALLATQPLYTAKAGDIIAGIPIMNLELSGLTGLESDSCAVPLGVGACDPILWLGIGHRKAGTERWDLLDDQLTPLRGFVLHQGRMNGVAERLAEGDQLALLIYGFHAQYPVTWSRDILVPASILSGTIELPLLGAAEVVRQGV